MAQKQPIPSGFDYKFVDPIEDEYICIICQSVLRSPVQTKCGHQFCKECLRLSHKKSGKQECPIDREQLTEQQIFSDKATERKILSFKVHCPNQGCTWQGELRDIQNKPVKPGQAVSQNHLDTCPMRVIPCSYKQFGCDFEGPQKSHSEHVITYHLAFTMEKMFSLQEENKKLKQQMETMAKDFEALEHQVHGISEQTDDDIGNIRKIHIKTTQLLDEKIISLEVQLDAFSEETNQNMATKSMISSLEQKYSKLDTECAKLNKNLEQKYSKLDTECAKLNKLMKYALITLVVVVVVAEMVVLWIQRSQPNHTALEDTEKAYLRDQIQYLTAEVKRAFKELETKKTDLRDQIQSLTGKEILAWTILVVTVVSSIIAWYF